MSIEGYFGKAD